ncbi:hypothetical protein BS47DRAFT_1337820 [Hydnum rufescens UP504]|uniref:Uncharacterized protein n=1 Tax=Hydnum rufescens UP504 TaxID=1448309 RepID=A0A9P6E154_9AGAM|nr:hypothetical protein BS47DRAFT_1337820 [Hydnum rufescens UP504]
MWGFNATADTPFYGAGVPGLTDNRPVVPLINRTFEQWWFHGYPNLPPHPEDIMQLPAGGSQSVEIACDKQFTSYWAMTGSATDQSTDSPCPGSPTEQFHTSGIDDLGGCALAIAYQSNASLVTPADFTVFSVNQTCVWKRNTEFQVPAAMPPCPNGKCTCAWFWIHREDAGSEQSKLHYMIAFQCNITGATGTQPVAKGNPARRCGADPKVNKPADPSNCTVGARTPSYWFQYEQNNFFEDAMQPPIYTDLYGWTDGAQLDIFRSVPFGTTPNTTIPDATTPNATTPSSTTVSSLAQPSSTATSTAPTSSPSTTPLPLRAPAAICLRPLSPSRTSNMMQVLADAIGLGSLRRRRPQRRLRKVE